MSGRAALVAAVVWVAAGCDPDAGVYRQAYDLKLKGKVDDAIAVVDRCGDAPRCLALRAVLLADTDRFAEAEPILVAQAARTSGRDKAATLCQLADVTRRKGEPARAIALAEEAAGIDPDARTPKQVLAEALASGGRCAEAVALLEKIELPNARARYFHARCVMKADEQKGRELLAGAYEALLLHTQKSSEIGRDHLYAGEAAALLGHDVNAARHKKNAEALRYTVEPPL